MTDQITLFHKYFRGSWYSQTNLYLIGEKIQKQSHNKLLLCFDKKTQNYITWYYNNNYTKTKLNVENIKFFSGFNTTISLVIEILNKNLFRVKYTNVKESLIYEEYIYSIGNNLIISRGILKSTKNNQYIGLIMNSYIRIQS